ncbi:hypothetical protein RVS70_05720 [Virgibacillus sp. M23]|uniref:DUF5048 domain-containing protein n=1 Tax=Virgibacillus sp. M23 TaxID=3079030 RepID=UPI002A919602|nr:hypothetical protein [Virgibacillus sp. M23]MDY7043699.1 hypothetical protein [Virgibacillus sp. M23]
MSITNYIKGDVVMNNRDITLIPSYIDLHLQPVRRLYITLEVIDKYGETIETIQGLSQSGSINISNSSLIRRTGSLSFVLYDYLIPKKASILWMTNKVRVYAGISDLSSDKDTVTHFCLGTFYITEPNVQINDADRSISINLQDNMMRWEQKELEDKFVIEAGTPLNTAVLSVLNYFGEFKTKIEFTELTIPYKLEFNVGETVMNMLTKLRDLYMDWDCYYDVDGTIIFEKMKIQVPEGEPIIWKFDEETDHLTSYSKSFSYKEVKNRILVKGVMDEKTGLTPTAEASISDDKSPFHKNEIGVQTKVITDGNYSNLEQCDSRARYELFKRSNFQEKLNLSSIPIYFLDANNAIKVRDMATNKLEDYIIDTISVGLGISDTMSISGHKLYYGDVDMDSTLDEVRKQADIIIEGIKNKGWLALSEQRIKDFYGIKGDGSKLIVRFEKQKRFGVTAYVTGYTDNSNQTLTIDLADFSPSSGDSGDNNAGKAEYSDRILGHEVVHAVMNNVFGVDKTIDMPVWFKEGSAEFIHGADERLKTIIVKNETINDNELTSLVGRGVELLEGANWNGESSDYTAGYLIIKYLDTQIIPQYNMSNLMQSILQSNKGGEQSIKDAIVEVTPFSTFDEFIRSFENNGYNYVKASVTLNLFGDELDTGSIAGSDHRGSTNLSAEDIFDNSLAEQGVSLRYFEVEFDRP